MQDSGQNCDGLPATRLLQCYDNIYVCVCVTADCHRASLPSCTHALSCCSDAMMCEASRKVYSGSKTHVVVELVRQKQTESNVKIGIKTPRQAQPYPAALCAKSLRLLCHRQLRFCTDTTASGFVHRTKTRNHHPSLVEAGTQSLGV